MEWIKTQLYSLPDIQILDSYKSVDFFLWQPDKTYVVLGRSDTPGKAINHEVVWKKNITVIQRPSGGHTVVLTPKTIVISLKVPVDKFAAKMIFRMANKIIIDSLEKQSIKNLIEKGISDIVIGNKKILGSSIYKTKTAFFYHAVLNVAEDPKFISKLLKHPVREPDYRQGRKHYEFVTSLKQAGYSFSFDLFKTDFSDLAIHVFRGNI